MRLDTFFGVMSCAGGLACFILLLMLINAHDEHDKEKEHRFARILAWLYICTALTAAIALST